MDQCILLILNLGFSFGDPLEAVPEDLVTVLVDSPLSFFEIRVNVFLALFSSNVLVIWRTFFVVKIVAPIPSISFRSAGS